MAGQSLRTAICTCCCWLGESVPDDGLNETWRNPLLAADHISPPGAFCERARMAVQMYRCPRMGQSVGALKPPGMTVSSASGVGAGERVAEGREDGEGVGEGVLDGVADGRGEGTDDGSTEGIAEGACGVTCTAVLGERPGRGTKEKSAMIVVTMSIATMLNQRTLEP